MCVRAWHCLCDTLSVDGFRAGLGAWFAVKHQQPVIWRYRLLTCIAANDGPVSKRCRILGMRRTGAWQVSHYYIHELLARRCSVCRVWVLHFVESWKIGYDRICSRKMHHH